MIAPQLKSDRVARAAADLYEWLIPRIDPESGGVRQQWSAHFFQGHPYEIEVNPDAVEEVHPTPHRPIALDVAPRKLGGFLTLALHDYDALSDLQLDMVMDCFNAVGQNGDSVGEMLERIRAKGPRIETIEEANANPYFTPARYKFSDRNTVARMRNALEVLTKNAPESHTLRDWLGSDEGMAALVFADIVGSTGLNGRIGDEPYAALRKPFDAHVEVQIKEHGGQLVNDMGDAWLVMFPTASKALDFALAAREHSCDGRLRLRVGIDVGNVRLKNGRVQQSNTPTFAQRIMSKGSAGEICVSTRAYEDIQAAKYPRHDDLRWRKKRWAWLKGIGLRTLWFVRARATVA